MSKHGLLITFIALTYLCQQHILILAANYMNVSKRTTHEELKFWGKDKDVLDSESSIETHTTDKLNWVHYGTADPRNVYRYKHIDKAGERDPIFESKSKPVNRNSKKKNPNLLELKNKTNKKRYSVKDPIGHSIMDVFDLSRPWKYPSRAVKDNSQYDSQRSRKTNNRPKLRRSYGSPWMGHSDKYLPKRRIIPSMKKSILLSISSLNKSKSTMDKGKEQGVFRIKKGKEEPLGQISEEFPKKEEDKYKVKKEEEEHKGSDNTPLSPYSLVQQLNTKLLPELNNTEVNATLEVLGKTMEYNDIVLVKAMGLKNSSDRFFRADDRYEDIVPEKKLILIVHGLTLLGFHKLPCLSTITGLKKLMSYYYRHLDKFDIFIIPMANPDGIANLPHKTIWNKNLSPQAACPGVALDRNFDVAWNSSFQVSSCNQRYPGAEPFSEPETQAIRDIFHKYSHRIYGYIHVHAGSFNPDIYKGDAVLHPKGYSETVNDDKYVDLRGEVEDMIKNASFKVYSFTVDSLYDWYGKISGSSVDYASSVYGVPFAMEFVMQLYEGNMSVQNSQEREQAIVLEEVWSRVIDVVFNFIYNNTKPDRK